MLHPRRYGRSLAATVLATTALAGLSACGSSEPSGSASSGGGASEAAATSATPTFDKVQGKKSVALVTCEPNVFCHAYNVNLKRILEGAGVSVTQLSDNFDPALQNQHMNQAIAQKPDMIVVFASNADAIVPALRRAQQAGITTVNVDARLKAAGERYVDFEVIADNPGLGRVAAQNLVEGLQASGRKEGKIILVTGTMGTLIVQDRLDAFNQYMQRYPQYQVVATEDGNWDQVKSSQIALQLLTKYRSQGGIAAAYGMADYQAAGIIQAAQQLGIPVGSKQPNGLIVTGSNCTPTGFPLLQSGQLYGDGTQSPIQESELAAKAIIGSLNGEKQQKTIVDKAQQITQSNYQQFTDLCSKWPK